MVPLLCSVALPITFNTMQHIKFLLFFFISGTCFHVSRASFERDSGVAYLCRIFQNATFTPYQQTTGLPGSAINRKMGDLKNDFATKKTKFVTDHKLGDLTREKSQIGLFRLKSICTNSFSSCSRTEITATSSTEKPTQTRNTQL